jgi:Putative inner membrane protein (DUF1819)
MDINVKDFQRSMAKCADEGKTIGRWSEPTITRIAQGLLSTLRDFGILQGGSQQEDRSRLPSPALFRCGDPRAFVRERGGVASCLRSRREISAMKTREAKQRIRWAG